MKTIDSEIRAYQVDSRATLVIENDEHRSYAEMTGEQLDELIAKLQRVRASMAPQADA